MESELGKYNQFLSLVQSMNGYFCEIIKNERLSWCSFFNYATHFVVSFATDINTDSNLKLTDAGNLVILSGFAEYSGRYRCLLQNNFTSATAEANITVKGKDHLLVNYHPQRISESLVLTFSR